jgi:hypothetical protein
MYKRKYKQGDMPRQTAAARRQRNLISRGAGEPNSAKPVPIPLNTPFNESEPMVCTPEDALDCFLRTKMDLLVRGSGWWGGRS